MCRVHLGAAIVLCICYPADSASYKRLIGGWPASKRGMRATLLPLLAGAGVLGSDVKRYILLD